MFTSVSVLSWKFYPSDSFYWDFCGPLDRVKKSEIESSLHFMRLHITQMVYFNFVDTDSSNIMIECKNLWVESFQFSSQFCRILFDNFALYEKDFMTRRYAQFYRLI